MSRRSSSDRPDPVVAVLGYHKIGDPGPRGWPTWFYVPEETFVRHLDLLERSGWPPIDLATFLAGLDDPARLPGRAVLLTFDDGHRSLREVAVPRLRQFGYPAVAFVPSDFVGRCNHFDQREPVEPLCDWDDLQALVRAGVAVQSHGATHRPFSTLDPEAQEDELGRSRRVLEAALGRPVEAFAFPFGDPGREPGAVRARLEKAGYRAAFLYGGGPVRLPADRFALPRIAVGPDTNLREVLG